MKRSPSRIGEIAALAARALGDQAAGAIDAGRMELHELHVLQRQAGAQHHGVAVAGAGVRRGAGEIGAAIAAGGEDGHVRAEAVDRAVVELERDDAAAAALVVHDQIDGEILDEELGRSGAATGHTCVCSMAWPVRSAAAQVRCAVPLP